MNSKDFLAIRDRLPELRMQPVDSRHGQIPKSIAYVEELIAHAKSRDDKAALYTLLLSECSYSKNYDLAVYFHRQQVRDLPDDPFPLTSLATSLAFSEQTKDEALTLATQAVALAKKQNRQVKYSLTCQARIALAKGDYNMFHEALRGLISDADKTREEDYHLEFDFLDHVDPVKVDQELMSRYRALAK